MLAAGVHSLFSLDWVPCTLSPLLVLPLLLARPLRCVTLGVLYIDGSSQGVPTTLLPLADAPVTDNSKNNYG